MSFNINKRNFLIKVPAVIGAATLAAPNIVRAQSLRGGASLDRAGAALGRDLVPVTYCPVGMQKQFFMNKKSVQGKPYSDFLTEDLTVPAAWAKQLQYGPLPPELTLTPSIADINKIFNPSYTYTFPDAGYALLDGPCAYVQSRIEMPGVTTDMFKWWFMWHPQEKQRYMLWFPQAHIDNSVQDMKRLANTSLTYEERLYKNPNFVDEFIGPSSMKVVIHFTDPVELGFDANLLKQAGIKASASGPIRLADAPDTTFMLMLHMARDTSRGLELFSRYWIGAHPELKRFPGSANAQSIMTKMGMNKDAVEQLAYNMSVHDMTEFNQLARILPALYEKFGQ